VSEKSAMRLSYQPVTTGCYLANAIEPLPSAEVHRRSGSWLCRTIQMHADRGRSRGGPGP